MRERRAPAGENEPSGVWVVHSPWYSLYRRAQGTKRQDTLFTVADVTTGVLSHYSNCTMVTSAHCCHAALSPRSSSRSAGSMVRHPVRARGRPSTGCCRRQKIPWYVIPRRYRSMLTSVPPNSSRSLNPCRLLKKRRPRFGPADPRCAAIAGYLGALRATLVSRQHVISAAATELAICPGSRAP